MQKNFVLMHNKKDRTLNFLNAYYKKDNKWIYYTDKIILCDLDFTTATDNDLIAAWRESVWQAYWQTTSANWLHFVTFQTDTPTGIELPILQNLTWRKLCRDVEWYAWTFTRWWNISLSIDKPVKEANTRYKYDTASTNAWWWAWLWSLPWYNCNYNWCQYAWVDSWIIWYWDWNSSHSITMYWDKWNHWLKWQPYWEDYSLDLPFTTWIYKWQWYWDFWSWQYYVKWITPNATEKEFSRDFSAESQANKDLLNTRLAWDRKYIRLRNNRWYWNNSSYDICYWRKAKIWIE